MNLFERLFGQRKTEPAKKNIRLGRFSDCYRSKAQEEAFDLAITAFRQAEYRDAFTAFFRYLLNENEQNVKLWENGKTLHFEFFQGSKRITGHADQKKFVASSILAKARTLQSNFMRRLLEENYELKFSRFGLSPQNELCILFDTDVADSSPYKLYAALKELAINADKHDDLLLDEFDVLEVTDMQIRREIPLEEKEIKYNYLVREIRDTLHEIDNSPIAPMQYPVAIFYQLLWLCYKLDYLTRPEGFMMETLERIHRLAFSQDGNDPSRKIQLLKKEFLKLVERPKEKFFAEMYEVTSTFGITTPVDHSKVALIIDQELPNMRWYKEKGYNKIAVAIPGFIIGRCFFNFAIPAPDRDLFAVLMRVIEAPFFQTLGMETYCKDQLPDEKQIRHVLKDIAHRYKTEYPKLNPDAKSLNFSTLPDFLESFLWMVRNLDYNT